MRSPTALACGAFVLGIAAVWQWALSPRWTQRIPQAWSSRVQYVGTAASPDPRTGRLPDGGALERYERAQRVTSEAGRPRWVELEERYTVRDQGTGRVVFDYTIRDTVSPETGAHVDARHRGEIALFPRDVERRSYRLGSNYLNGIPLRFEQVEVLEGLSTYLFTYRGRLEQSAVYANSTGDFGGFQVSPGQEVHCLDDQFYYRIWIEPRTGEQVKLEEGCPSGDYVVDVASGRALRPLARWTGVTAGDDLIQRISDIRTLRWRYLWESRYLALVLLAIGAPLIIAGLLPRRRPTA
jgi:DUF3068 family protein